MRKLICFLMATIMFVACGKDDFSFNVKEEIKNPYAVTPEEAVQLLQTVIGDETTRSVSISDVQTLTKGNFTQTTRSGADDEVIYIVDIEGGGSAIMGADKRMEPIYAVLDNTKITAEQLVGAATRSESEGEDIGDFVLGLLNNAIQRDIQEVETAGIEMPIIPRDQYWTETTVIAYQQQMLNTSWHQGDPFNRMYGYVPGTPNRYSAGCGPIALAQILYHNRYPSSINGEIFNWNLIAQYEDGYLNPSNAATNEVANFVYQIKVRSNALPTGNGTAMGLQPEEAATFMRITNYPDATLVNYSINTVIDMVSNKQLPVYVAAVNTNDSTNGHAWVIDGCNVYRIDEWCRHYIDSLIYNDTIENTETYNLVHCKFGWIYGIYDGEYTSGIFNTPEGNYNIGLQMITY